MNILLHCCCAPCAVSVIDALGGEDLQLLWYNPNVQPLGEQRARRDTLVGYADALRLPLTVEDGYDLAAWLDRAPTLAAGEARCRACYEPRLDRAAALAAERGCDAFSTTLLVSPYQRHDLLRELGEAAAVRHGVAFLYRDWRPDFRAGQRRARELGLYMQKYCGCVLSLDEATR